MYAKYSKNHNVSLSISIFVSISHNNRVLTRILDLVLSKIKLCLLIYNIYKVVHLLLRYTKSVRIQQNSQSFLPEQKLPLPVYPERQVHMKPSSVSEQAACSSQLCN